MEKFVFIYRLGAKILSSNRFRLTQLRENIAFKSYINFQDNHDYVN